MRLAGRLRSVSRIPSRILRSCCLTGNRCTLSSCGGRYLCASLRIDGLRTGRSRSLALRKLAVFTVVLLFPHGLVRLIAHLAVLILKPVLGSRAATALA